MRTALTLLIAAALATFLSSCAQETAEAADQPRRAAMEETVRAFYQPFSDGNVDVFDDILTEDWTETPLAPGQEPGRENYKPVVAGLAASAPDLTIAVQEVIVEGDLAAVRSQLSATHSAEMLGVPATGRTFEIMTMDIHRFEGDRIAETWHVEDWLSALQQIGAINGEQAAAAEEARTPADNLFGLIFKSADRNDDGNISPAEATTFQANLFRAMDANDDRALTRTEFVSLNFGEGYEAAKRGREADVRRVLDGYFDWIDGNADGIVRSAEQQIVFRRDFRQSDLNADGGLNQDEFVRALPILQELRTAIGR